MNRVKSNIDNLTSLWRTVSEPDNGYINAEEFDSCVIKYSEWPNKLWFNHEIKQGMVKVARERLLSLPVRLTLPYWDIYKSNSYELLEQNGFKLKFEQLGMSLKLQHSFTESRVLKIREISNVEEAVLWSDLFSKSFGYFISPLLIRRSYGNTTFYLAYHENEAVGTGILHTTNNVTGIHSVGVIPEHRRKGFADKIMKLLINQSIILKSEYATLQASNMGKGLYSKLGFETHFGIRNYVLQ